MEGGRTDEEAGMIPRAIDMIFRVSGQLKDRGWKYQMEGQFLEVYNEVVSNVSYNAGNHGRLIVCRSTIFLEAVNSTQRSMRSSTIRTAR
jgi:hypothetical protein